MQQEQFSPPAPHLLTEFELAAYLGIKVATLRKWRVLGQGVPWIKINGSLVRYRLADVSAYLDSCPRTPAQVSPAAPAARPAWRAGL